MFRVSSLLCPRGPLSFIYWYVFIFESIQALPPDDLTFYMAQSHAGNDCDGAGIGFVICPRLQNGLFRRCLYGLLQNDWKMKLCLKKKDHLDDFISFTFKFVFSAAAARPKNNLFHCSLCPCDLPRVDLVNLSYFRAHLSDSLILYNTLCIFLSLALFFVCWLGMDCSCSSEIANIKLSMIKMCFRMRGWFQNVLKVINFIINDHIFCISVYHLHTLHCCLFLLYESCFYNGACFSGEPLLNIWCCLWNIM